MLKLIALRNNILEYNIECDLEEIELDISWTIEGEIKLLLITELVFEVDVEIIELFSFLFKIKHLVINRKVFNSKFITLPSINKF